MEKEDLASPKYHDWEKRQHVLEMAQYDEKVAQFKQNNPQQEWKCGTCGALNGGRLHSDSQGLWGQYCRVKSCQYSTLLFKRPQRNYVHSSDGPGYYALPSEAKGVSAAVRSKVESLIKGNPISEDLKRFDWNWIHDSVRKSLQEPKSRDQMLSLLVSKIDGLGRIQDGSTRPPKLESVPFAPSPSEYSQYQDEDQAEMARLIVGPSRANQVALQSQFSQYEDEDDDDGAEYMDVPDFSAGPGAGMPQQTMPAPRPVPPRPQPPQPKVAPVVNFPPYIPAPQPQPPQPMAAHPMKYGMHRIGGNLPVARLPPGSRPHPIPDDVASGMDEGAIRAAATRAAVGDSLLGATVHLFSDEFCRALLDYSQQMEQHQAWREMLRDLHGIPVSLLGLQPLFDGLAEKLTAAARVLEPYANHTIQFEHGFTLSFSSERPFGQNGHFPHTDDTDFTINTCLGGNFTGANLNLSGGNQYHALPQKPGLSILHNGRTLHNSADVVGFRQNLILFFRVQSSFEFWEQLPADAKAYVMSFAPSHTMLSMFGCVNKETRQICTQYERVIWSKRYEQTFKKPVPQGEKSVKQKFIKQFKAVADYFNHLTAVDEANPYIPMKAIVAPPMPARYAPQFGTIFRAVKGTNSTHYCPIQ